MRLARRMERLGTETAFEVLARARELEAAGRSVCHLEIDPATLRRARGGIFNTPHNPTGGLIGAADWDRIAGLDLEWLISDEVYAEILFGGEHASALAHPALRDKTILCDAFSKTWSMTGWRLGYGVFPPATALAEAVTRLQINCTSCAATFSQRAALAALRGPREPLERMVQTFRRRRDLFVSGLNGLPGVSCAEPRGAFYALPNVRGVTDDAAALAHRLLEEAGVACVAGTAFGEAGRDHIRFSFAAPWETLREALARMARLLG